MTDGAGEMDIGTPRSLHLLFEHDGLSPLSDGTLQLLENRIGQFVTKYNKSYNHGHFV